MPLTENSKLLARTQPLSADNWLSLVESRRALIYGAIGDIGLQRLGDTLFYYECQPGWSIVQRVRDEIEGTVMALVSPANMNLETRGIFYPVCARRIIVEHPYADTHFAYVFGISRRHGWVLVTISFLLRFNPDNSQSYWADKRVKIREASLPEILKACPGLAPRKILRQLSETIKACHDKKQKSATEWRARWHAVRAEDELLSEVLQLTEK
jgi:hypothetical protein